MGEDFMNQPNSIQIHNANTMNFSFSWDGPPILLQNDPRTLRSLLLNFNLPVWIIQQGQQLSAVQDGKLSLYNPSLSSHLAASAPALTIDHLGDPLFQQAYGLRAPYYAGAMANAIASEGMVIALGRSGLMGSFGAGGCAPARVEAAIQKIQAALPNGPYAFNLLNNPYDPSTEMRAAELFVKYNIHVVEASAYLDMTHALVYYRAAGLSRRPDGSIHIANHVIAKISRKEVARRFMEPAPADILHQLVVDHRITEQQADLAGQVSMADDLTVEADSGGHTDNRPLVCLLPAIQALRDEIQLQRNYPQIIRVGAAGGISTPQSALAAFAMGAAYIATGSVNQACLESGASEHTRNLLAQADMADVTMAPSADMFEMGVKVQVLKRGTLFPVRALKLYEIYTRYNALEDIPAKELEKLETQVFKREVKDIWADTEKFFNDRDPSMLKRSSHDPHQKMALVFRWYLGLSSRWASTGEKGREMDYQIWCGPSMGAFNEWTRSTYLEKPQNRHVVDIAEHILTGSAYLYRIRFLAAQGVQFSSQLETYQPTAPLIIG